MSDSVTTQDGITEQPNYSELSLEEQQAKAIEVLKSQWFNEEVAKGYMLQADYTKKTQEIAQLKKQPQEQPQQQFDDEATTAYLKQLGFPTREEIEAFNKQRQNDSELQDILRDIPELANQKDAIKSLAEKDWISAYEAAQKYGFTTKEKLERAKTSSWPMGTNSKEKKEVSIMDMSPEEYLKWKSKEWITTGVK